IEICFMDLFPVCSDELKIEVKTVTAGQNVTLNCPRQSSALYRETFYWIRLVSGNWPEFLGATANFKTDDVSKIPHVQTKQEEGEFHLHINEAKRNDTGLYYCIKLFLFLTCEKNSDTLQCSVLSDSEKKSCPSDNRVYWFKARSDNSPPSLLYLQGISGDECESSPKAPSAQKCFYKFSENSDSGIYHCAVAACGQILFGNGAKLGAGDKSLPNYIYTDGNRENKCEEKLDSQQRCVYNFSKTVNASDATFYCAVATCGEIYFGNGTNMDIKERRNVINGTRRTARTLSEADVHHSVRFKIFVKAFILEVLLNFILKFRTNPMCNSALDEKVIQSQKQQLHDVKTIQGFYFEIFSMLHFKVLNESHV
uniref:Uncharacterized LOC111607139 n=1 Tax=Xiphophorus maculatus TaxID=8083 RepID=A0A3B5QFE7_XIPMA